MKKNRFNSSNHIKKYFDGIKDIAVKINKKEVDELAKSLNLIRNQKGRLFF